MNIKVINLYTGNYNQWVVPSKYDLLDRSKTTWGKQYDKIEREIVEGGLPYVMQRVQ